MQDWDPYKVKCPSRLILARVADKWALLLLGLLKAEPLRFNALRRQIEGISQKMLSHTLKNLERDGLVTRTVYPTVPVTVEYQLTAMGRDLTSIVDSVRTWTLKNADGVLAAQKHYDQQIAEAKTPRRIPLASNTRRG